MSDGAARWARAVLALRCLGRDPAGLGGIVLRARAGPVRDAFLALTPEIGLPHRRIPPTIQDDQLFGGVDLAATLNAGRVVRSRGILAEPSTLILAMAERCDTGLAARLSQHLDTHSGACLILLDEGAEPDERAPDTIAERLAFHIDLDGLTVHDLTTDPAPQGRDVEGIAMPDTAIAELVALALRFGIDSLRAPILALRTARAHAALAGRDTVSTEDLMAAAALVYPARATCMPAEDEETDAPEEPEAPQDSEDAATPEDVDDAPVTALPAEMMIEAVRALLPPGLLDQLKSGRARKASGSGAGAKRKGNRRGRPLPPRRGRLDGRARIDLVATLRAAAPWQPLRRRTHPDAPGLLIRASDIRLRRYEETSDRLLIFTVDASGSAAVSRLNEAKGAVELLLGEAYARRDQVALIAFRGLGAELLLPPTRSLVQTKRRLAALPGGGGTPLAAGLREAGALATLSRGKGLSPTVVVMTDGRANIALDGAADRPRAAEDSARLAGQLRAQGIPGLMIDMSKRPQPGLQTLAAQFDAPYLPLPRADARSVSAAVNGALDG